ncbi:MAG: acylphosphatase [Aphanothece sp. CMT-3BRIN-NPC111]|nr:acylphosphatase [Aphanothece sp. CMT-3BRIN-NPC111]
MTDLSKQRGQIRAHVFVSGMVQGVGYRFSTLDEANQWGLNGWVRNISDGRVEAVFEGNKAAVEEMIRWCYKGPAAAVVEEVTVDYEEPEGVGGFEITR